jgi:predicted DNA-binding transcriptional regulator AlpA
MAPKVDTGDLVGAAEVAEILGLSHPSSVSTYAKRYSDFPRPILELPKSKVRLWRRSEIIRWTRSAARSRSLRNTKTSAR